jgi:flavin-dependent dehydrogenase
MAAYTAASRGFKVVLVERKKNIAEVTRACGQILYVRPFSPLAGGRTYMEPVSVDVGTDVTLFRNVNIGFTVEYRGQLRPYLNWLQVSPAGHVIHRFKPNERPWGFFYEKDVFLAGLLDLCGKAGVQVMSETIGLGAENTPTGVRVRVRTAAGEETMEAANAVAADGLASKIADSLGLGSRRKMLGPGMSGVSYIVEGIKSPLATGSLISYTIPSLGPAMNIVIGQRASNTNSVGGVKFKYEDLAVHPAFQTILSGTHVIATQGWAADIRSPMLEPVAGNVVIIGDATAPIETWTMGAVACAYQAVMAIEKERQNQSGYADYVRWWRGAFAFNQPDYFKIVSDYYAFNRVCSDADIDYLFGLLSDRIGIPGNLIAENMDLIRRQNPELHERLLHSKDKGMFEKK